MSLPSPSTDDLLAVQVHPLGLEAYQARLWGTTCTGNPTGSLISSWYSSLDTPRTIFGVEDVADLAKSIFQEKARRPIHGSDWRPGRPAVLIDRPLKAGVQPEP